MNGLNRFFIAVAIIALLLPLWVYLIKYVTLSNRCFAHLSEIMTILTGIK